MSDFTTFDFIVIGIMLISLLIGLRRGFTSEFLRLAAWVITVFITITTLPITTEFAQTIIPVAFIANIVALVIVFFVSLALLNWIAKFIGEQIRTSLIGPLDRALGAFFGLLRGLLVISAGFLIISYFLKPDNHPDWMKEAKLYNVVADASAVIAKIIPDIFDKAKNFTNNLDPETKDILDAMEPNQPTIDGLVESGKDLAVEYSDEIREELDELVEDVQKEDDDDAG